ncbi:GDP-L-galactose phosphorylase 2-like isoform X1 [Nymphaea colorata]|nr:GDP-L-galactose phosphorylase 2-like isoform X1 [Nymphaea colorata]
MLSIKRVPTVVSNYQEGCGRNCLGKCCLLGAKFPRYTYRGEKGRKYVENDGLSDRTGEMSLFDTLLMGEWEDRMSRGLFRYDVTACETKVIPGKYGFIAQLNEGRHLKKRPTEFRVDRVLQPFDPSKFNFTRVGQEEVLFRFEEDTGSEDHHAIQFFLNPHVSASASPSVIAINVSPIEYGHVLLIPRIFDCLPQKMDKQSLLLALHMAAEAANPFFRVGYNSLGAFATINHLHFQAYYFNMPFPVEKVPTRRLSGKSKNGVEVHELLNYPVRGLVFQGGDTLQNICNQVSLCCIYLQENNVPFNLLISDSGKRVFLFPQCYAEKQALGGVSQELLETQVNPAVWEISGHMVLKRKQDYEDASEEYAWKLLAEVSLSQERFEEVKSSVMEAAFGDSDDTLAIEASEETESMCLLKEVAANGVPGMASDEKGCLVHQ